MRMHSVLLTLLLLVPSPSISLTLYNKTTPCEQEKEKIKLQQSRDITKLELALIAAIVTIVTVKLTDKYSTAIAFDRLIMFLWNK